MDTLPTGAIALFDSASFPTFHWTAYAPQDNSYIRGGAVDESGGSNNHLHQISGTSGTFTSSAMNDGVLDEACTGSSSHSHGFDVRSTDGSSQPQHVELVAGQVTHPMGAPLTAGIIALFEVDPGADWTRMAAFDDSYIRATAAPDATPAGSNSHTHGAGASQDTTGGGSPNGIKMRTFQNDTTVASSHTHPVNHAETDRRGQSSSVYQYDSREEELSSAPHRSFHAPSPPLARTPHPRSGCGLF